MDVKEPQKTAVLTTVIKVMFVVLILAVLYVLLSFSGGASRISSPKSLFDDVAYGQTALRRVSGDKVWVTRLDFVRRQQRQQLESSVVDERSGCEPEAELCLLSAQTSRAGIDIVYSQKMPEQLSTKTLWFGGFVDPTTGEVFDRYGRAYQETAQGRAQLAEYYLP